MTWEKSDTCTKCRKVRDGSHSSYCRVCYREYSKAWCKANPDKVRAKGRRQDLKRTYGITPEDWDAMLARQNGGCAICGTTTPGGRGRFHVDHDHVSGRIRGLLCTNCNVALGLVQDNTTTLLGMVSYLQASMSDAGVVTT